MTISITVPSGSLPLARIFGEEGAVAYPLDTRREMLPQPQRTVANA